MVHTIIKIIIVILVLSCNVYAANFPLEIILPKASGTGSPAIPSTHRIFYAYPGIEYNIRAAAIGGVYPYTYALSGEPEGMTIDADTGEISWANPQSSSGTITLSVTDADETTAQASWAITVGTDNFLFVDSTYSGSETGSITQPFSSISNLLNNSTGGQAEYIVYFRAGNYALVEHNCTYIATGDATGKYGCNISYSTVEPHKWINYPGETVNIDGDGRYIEAVDVYFDGLNFSDFSDYGILVRGAANYNVIRNCQWNTIAAVRAGNSNQGFYTTPDLDLGFHYYHVLQDNDYSGNTGAQAIGSLYSCNSILIENNNMHDGGYTDSNPVHFQQGVGFKYANVKGTIRGNKIVVTDDHAVDLYLGYASTADNVEVCYNYLQSLNSNPPLTFSSPSDKPWYLDDVFVFRNTVIGSSIQIIHDPDTSNFGPYYLYNNVDQLADVSHPFPTSTEIIWTDNLEATSGLVDGDGKLTGDNTIYVGTRGWQLASGSTPMELGDTAPDIAPPSTTITTGSPIATSTGSVTIEGTATDDTAVSGVKCRIGAEPDANNGTACTGTTSWSCTISGLASGSNTVYCEAYDAAGNYDSGNTITANYTPPTANVTGVPFNNILWQ